MATSPSSSPAPRPSRTSWRIAALGVLALAASSLLAYWLVDRQARSVANDALQAFSRELPDGVTFSYAEMDADAINRRLTLRGVSLRDSRGEQTLSLSVARVVLDKVERSREQLSAEGLSMSGLHLESEDGRLAADLQDLMVESVLLPLPQALPPDDVLPGLLRGARLALARAEGFSLRRQGESLISGRMESLALTALAEGRLDGLEITDVQLERAENAEAPASEIERVALGRLSARESDLAGLLLRERTVEMLRSAPTALEIEDFAANRLGLPTASSETISLQREGGAGGPAMGFSASWETIRVPLDYLRSAELRRLLLSLGYEALEVDGALAYRFEVEDHGLVLEPLRLSIAGVGGVEGRLSVDSLPPSVPGLMHLPEGGWQALRVREAALTYHDDSLVQRLIALGASESGMSEEDFRALLLSEFAVIGTYGKGAALGRETLESFEAFVRAPESLGVRAHPDSPVSLGDIFTAPVMTGPGAAQLDARVSLGDAERGDAELGDAEAGDEQRAALSEDSASGDGAGEAGEESQAGARADD